MSQANYFYQDNSPNIVVTCMEENIDQNLPFIPADFGNTYPESAPSAGQNFFRPINTELIIPTTLLTQEHRQESQFLEPASSENYHWQNNVQYPVAINTTTAWYNFNPTNHQNHCPAEILLQNYQYNNYYQMPEYSDPYIPSKKPRLQDDYVENNACVNKNKVKPRSSYDDIVDSFVKSNLESLKKDKYKDKDKIYKKKVIPSQKKSKTHEDDISGKKIVSIKTNDTPNNNKKLKKITPVKKVLSPKKNTLSDSPISESKLQSTSLAKTPISWTSKYLKSIGLNQQIRRNVQSKKKILKETKQATDSNSDEKSVVNIANNGIVDKYQESDDVAKIETLQKTLQDIDNEIKSIEQRSGKQENQTIKAINKMKVKKTDTSVKQKIAKFNSTLKTKSTINININKRSMIHERITKKQTDYVKENIPKGNTTLLDKQSSKCATYEENKISNKTKIKPNCQMRSIVEVPLNRRQINESKVNSVEDLRTILDGKKRLRKFSKQIRETHKKSTENSVKTANKKANIRKPIKKIKLVINIVHSNQEEQRQSDESSSQNDFHEDVSFLDDIDINVLIDCLNDCNNKTEGKEDKDNTQQVDLRKGLEKENLSCFEKDLKAATDINDNFSNKCAIEEKLAHIFSESSKSTSPNPGKDDGNAEYCDNLAKTKLDSIKNNVDLTNENNLNSSDLNGNSKQMFVKESNQIDTFHENVHDKVFNSGLNQWEYISWSSEFIKNNNKRHIFKSSCNDTTLNIESMIAQIHGEEVLPKLEESNSYNQPLQPDIVDLTIEKESVEYITIQSNRSNDDTEDKASQLDFIDLTIEKKSIEYINIQSNGKNHVPENKPSQFDSVDLTIEKGNMEYIKIQTNTPNHSSEDSSSTKDLKLDNDSLHCDNTVSIQKVVGPIQNTQHIDIENIHKKELAGETFSESKKTIESNEVLQTSELTDIKECKEKANVLDNTLNNIPKMCTTKDKDKLKKQKEDNVAKHERDTKQSNKNIQKPSNNSLQPEIDANTRHIDIENIHKKELAGETFSESKKTIESNEVLQTSELTDIKECKEKANVIDNTLNNIPKMCTTKDKDKLKKQKEDNVAKHERDTKQSNKDIQKPSNKSLQPEIDAKISEIDRNNINKKPMHKTITETNEIRPIFTNTKDRVLVAQLEEKMLSYLQEEYKVISKIHEGGFSTIYKCINSEKQKFAVKVLNTGSNQIKFGMVRETMTLKYQSDIPKENLNCVFLVNSFSLSNSRWGLLMEYYPRNVQKYLEDTGTFHIDVIQQLARQLVGAVIMLRHYNIVHSDIKPNHILINGSGDQIKLCGFDRSYYTQPSVLAPNIGTASYRAPEVILGYSASFSIDVWSTAVVLYEMATGSKLFPGHYNNDILFKQMCLCGNMPLEMTKTFCGKNHFKNSIFMRQVGVRGETRVPVKHFRIEDKLGLRLYNAYARDWVKKRYDSQVNRDAAKLQVFQRLIEQMLLLHPSQRIAVEFVYASPFLFQK